MFPHKSSSSGARRRAGWSGILCVGLGLIALMVACSDRGTPSAPSPPPATTPAAPTNNPPVIDTITVTDFIVSGLAPGQMSARASDPDGDALTYQWSYPSGSFTGPDYATSMTGDGSVSVTLRVTDARGASASATKTVVIGTMTGRWNYIPTNGSSCGVFGLPGYPVMNLTQSGRVVTGDITSPTPWCNVPAG